MTVNISNTGFWSNVNPEDHACCVELCDWIANYFKFDKDIPVYDFGCGVGQYSERLSKAGYKVIGFEGKMPNRKIHDNIREQDLTKPFTLDVKGNCVFLEVAEHVPATFENTMLDNISGACDKHLVMSWAVRGQPGWGHVNCLNNDEAIQRVEAKGFTFLSDKTTYARQAIPDDTKLPWFKNTTLVFKKNA